MEMEMKIIMARVVEQAEKNDDLVDFLKDFIFYKNTDFNTQERKLLSARFIKFIEGKT